MWSYYNEWSMPLTSGAVTRIVQHGDWFANYIIEEVCMRYSVSGSGNYKSEFRRNKLLSSKVVGGIVNLQIARLSLADQMDWLTICSFYYTVTFSNVASPMGLSILGRHSQPPQSFAACLVSGTLWLFT